MKQTKETNKTFICKIRKVFEIVHTLGKVCSPNSGAQIFQRISLLYGESSNMIKFILLS